MANVEVHLELLAPQCSLCALAVYCYTTVKERVTAEGPIRRYAHDRHKLAACKTKAISAALTLCTKRPAVGVKAYNRFGSLRATENETMQCPRAELPRLYELKDLIANPKSSDAYFQDFEEKLEKFDDIKAVYLRWEMLLEELDATAWEHLKKEAFPRLTKRDKKGRGWEQLFDILNEARAYRYLRSIGCTQVRFIPRSNTKTPDLEGVLGEDHVLCEVKTINPSDGEVEARTGLPRVRSLPLGITPEFLKKLLATVESAQQQMQAYDLDGSATIHFVYLNVTFDDFFAECKEVYFQQIDRHLETAQVSGIRLVVCNDHTAYYKPLQMRFAHVDNDGLHQARHIAPSPSYTQQNTPTERLVADSEITTR